MARKKKKAPVRQVKNNPTSLNTEEAIPEPEPRREPVEEPVKENLEEKQPEEAVQEPVPEKEEENRELPDNVVPMPSPPEGPEFVEDPVAVFKLCMLEADMQKIQLQQQLEAKHATEQIAALIARRDASLTALQAQFEKTRRRHVTLKEHVEEKYKINLKKYVYDDEVGAFKKITKKS